ncbi:MULTISPECIES: N-acetylglucosamine kinase [Shewanella]|uniref:ATPase n=1 Tax=Shewanella marisflavi TaxID=260364 RepID=A0ABX5WQR8_9GAMM|nr:MULTISPECIES: BadF/BadG/BcrA/BcrD ATPase family protein [Shewanella]QDF76115.1 ATPase [Shewanella marisflavi]
MGFNQTEEQALFIGIDGGGSKCRATIYASDDSVVGTGVAGRANPLYGLTHTFDSIIGATELALKDAGLAPGDSKQLIAGVGLAGVNVQHLYNEITSWQHPFAKMYVTTDLHTACIGAHRGGDGAVIITGTGSCGYAHVGDKSLSLGGHGFALGDKGSGAWLGLQAAQQVLLHLDGFGPATLLTERLLSHFKVSDAMGIVEHLAGQSSGCYATLARTVLSCAQEQDPVAKAIVMEGAEYISALAKRLFEVKPPRFSMIGGLAEPLAPWLDKGVVEKISPILAPPELGAAYFARQRHGISQD